MCSRYSLTSPPEAVRETFAFRDLPNFPPRYNIAPTQEIGVVCLDRPGERRFRMMRWGLIPSFVEDPKSFTTLINARAESVLAKPAFRHGFARRRCLVPADGFYEWTGRKGAKRPFLLRPAKGGLIAFAGLWERWRGRGGAPIDSVAIITCDANATVSSLHDRMPVVIDPADYAAWLDCERTAPQAATAFLQPAPDDFFEAVELHPKINDSRREEPGVQEPIQAELPL